MYPRPAPGQLMRQVISREPARIDQDDIGAVVGAAEDHRRLLCSHSSKAEPFPRGILALLAVGDLLVSACGSRVTVSRP